MGSTLLPLHMRRSLREPHEPVQCRSYAYYAYVAGYLLGCRCRLREKFTVSRYACTDEYGQHIPGLREKFTVRKMLVSAICPYSQSSYLVLNFQCVHSWICSHSIYMYIALYKFPMCPFLLNFKIVMLVGAVICYLRFNE
jgi:hypothetical protein